MIKGIIFDWIGTVYDRDNGTFPFAPDVLEKLSKTYKLALVSVVAQGLDKRDKELKESGITHYFDPIIVDTTKDEEQFLRCINQMGLSDKEVAIVGDRTHREIRIGNALGCETYWIRNGYFADEVPNEETGQPTQTIDTIEDLLKFL